MNRRQFLIQSAVAVAAAPLTGSAESTGSPLRVVVIGHTKRGDYGHGVDVMWLKIPRTQLVAVADPVAAGLQAATKRLGDIRRFVSYHEMLREMRPDVVAIALRHVDQHHEMCLAAAEAGARGIYIEKPFCRTPREADEIIAACASKGCKLAVAHRNRWDHVLPTLKKLISGGEIGKLLEIRSRGKEDHRGGAQDLWVLGSHLFNLATYFAGEPVAVCGQLYQDGRPCGPQDLRSGDEGIGPIAGNEVHARFEMAGGIPLFFDSIKDRGDKDAGFGLQIIGTTGVIDFRIDTAPLAQIRRGNPHHPTAQGQPWQPISSAGIGQPEPLPQLASRLASHQVCGEDLVDAILGQRQPLCSAAEGRTTVEMICSIFESHRQNGARISWPLKNRDHPLKDWRI